MILHIVIVLSCVAPLLAQREEGDACSTARFGAAGTCRLLAECPAAIIEFSNGQQPAMCGFKGRDAIICCANPVTPKPEVMRSNRLSARSE